VSAEYVGVPRSTGEFILRDVTVVDVADGSRSGGIDVRISGGTITEIGAVGQNAAGVTVVDGGGAFVVPGYVDSHAHALNDPGRVAGAYALMLANGITGFRQMSGSPKLLKDRQTGRLPAPPGAPALLATAGTLLTPLNSATPADAAAEVRAQHEQGADFIKAGLTSHDSFLAALAEATRVGMPLAGHLPGDVDPREAARGGMRCIEHLGPGVTVFAAACTCEAEIRALPPRAVKLPKLKLPGMEPVLNRVLRALVVNPAVITKPQDVHSLELADETYDEERVQQLAGLFAEHQTWHCPTLIRLHTQQFADQAEHTADVRLRFIAPDETARWRKSAAKFARLPEQTRRALCAHWPVQLRLTKALADAGVPLLAGTDANGAGWVIPGFGLHDEFDLLAVAGLSPLQILQSATSAPASFLGLDAVAGRVAPGYRADLVLLGRDPVAGHQALHEIRAVVRAGDLWSRSDLDGILARAEASPAAR
jgi:imidazolonepropionase-like amidohydrolase